MEGTRVNKITATYNGEDGVTMTLYRTHLKLATITNKDINVPAFKESKAQNKPAYMEYCKEILVNLLENGGVPGYYYDPKNESTQAQNGVPKKFGENEFIRWATKIADDKMTSMDLGPISHDMSDMEPSITVDENYKDGYIKYGTARIPFTLSHADVVGNKEILIPVDIKSGQLCKPKSTIIGGEERSLNTITIKALFQVPKKDGDNKPTVDKSKLTGLGADAEIERQYIKDMTAQIGEKAPTMVDKLVYGEEAGSLADQDKPVAEGDAVINGQVVNPEPSTATCEDKVVEPDKQVVNPPSADTPKKGRRKKSDMSDADKASKMADIMGAVRG